MKDLKREDYLEEEAWATLSAISNECPYKKCDGTGLIYMFNKKTFKSKLIVCACREEKKKEQEIQRLSKIPESFQNATISSFELGYYEGELNQDLAYEAKHSAVNFVKNYKHFEEYGKGLYLYSKTKGSGKTRMVCSIGNALMKNHNKKVHFTSTYDLLNNIRNTFKENSKVASSELLDMYRNIDVLILDDIGLEKVTDWVTEIFTQILNERMENKKVTLFTSNVNINNLNFDTKTEEKTDATERIISRITKMAIQVQMPEENIRDLIAEQESDKLGNYLFGDE